MKIDGADITLNLFDEILANLSDEQRLEVAKMVCFDDVVLDDFVTKLMTDYASDMTDSHIHKARLRFMELMPEAACQLIRALVSENNSAKSSAQHYRDYYYKMDEAWPGHIDCPDCGKHIYTRPSERPQWASFSSPSADHIMKSCGFAPATVETEDIP